MMIDEREENFRNIKKTALEEKVLLEELRKMKKSLKLLPEVEKLQKTKDILKKKIDIKKIEIRKFYKVIDKLKAE